MTEAGLSFRAGIFCMFGKVGNQGDGVTPLIVCVGDQTAIGIAAELSVDKTPVPIDPTKDRDSSGSVGMTLYHQLEKR